MSDSGSSGPEATQHVGAIILAAGASRRLGEPKQLVLLDGETLLERAIRVAEESRCSPVLVVLGAEYDRIAAGTRLRSATPVRNEAWQEGMASSIRAGVHALQQIAPAARGAILMVCDQPSVTPQHLRQLATSGATTASAYGGRRGVPAYFPPETFPALLALQGDSGARTLLENAFALELRDGDLDIDSRQDIAKARSLHQATNLSSPD